MRRVTIFVLLLSLLCGNVHGAGQQFGFWWPWIYRYVNVAKTNVINPDGSFSITQDNHNVWISIGTNNPGSNAWDWVQENSNCVAYMCSRTGAWDQAAEDASDWTNWWYINSGAWLSLTNDQAYYNSWTALWVQAVADAGSWTNWYSINAASWTSLTNDQAWYNAHTSGWEIAWDWVQANSGGVASVFSRTSLWDQAAENATFFTNMWDHLVYMNNSGVLTRANSAAGGIASGVGSWAEGYQTKAYAVYSHAEGDRSIASNLDAHAEGETTLASGVQSHAEGKDTVASGSQSHAQGLDTLASGAGSHAEGSQTVCSGLYAHVEGFLSSSGGDASHAEGLATEASGDASHAEGDACVASGSRSHAAGQNASAIHDNTYVWSDNNAVASTTNQTYRVHASAGIFLAGGDTEVEDADAEKEAVNWRVLTNMLASIPLIFGEMYVDGTNVQNLTGSYAILTNWTLYAASNVTASAAAGTFTLSVDGTYYSSIHISFEGGVNEEYEAAVHINGVELDQIEAQRKTSNNDLGSMSGSGYFRSTNGAVVTLRAKSLDAAANFAMKKCQFNLHRMR